MEMIFEFISFVVGRIILGSVGAFSRKLWFHIKSIFWEPEIRKNRKGDFDAIIDVEGFKNRIVGFFVIIAIIVLVIYLFDL